MGSEDNKGKSESQDETDERKDPKRKQQNGFSDQDKKVATPESKSKGQESRRLRANRRLKHKDQKSQESKGKKGNVFSTRAIPQRIDNRKKLPRISSVIATIVLKDHGRMMNNAI